MNALNIHKVENKIAIGYFNLGEFKKWPPSIEIIGEHTSISPKYDKNMIPSL